MKSRLLLLFLIISGKNGATEHAATFEISKIEDGVYLHSSYKNIEDYGSIDSHGLIIVDEKRAFIIDTPWSEEDTESLLQWVAGQGLTAEASLSTHFHDDRVAGIEMLNSKNVPTYTSALTNELLRNRGKPTAINTFSSDEFVLRQGKIEVFYPGPGHTKDNVVVWLPESKILFGGCLVRSFAWTSLGNIRDADLKSWADSIKNTKLKYQNISMIVPGHGEIGDAGILDHTLRLANKVSNQRVDKDYD